MLHDAIYILRDRLLVITRQVLKFIEKIVILLEYYTVFQSMLGNFRLKYDISQYSSCYHSSNSKF